MNTAILEQVIEQLKVMPQDLQWQVLEFARTLLENQALLNHGMNLPHAKSQSRKEKEF